MGRVDDLLASADRFARDFAHGDLPSPPALEVAVVTCMDCRIDPAALLGLGLGDAHVIRNAGGLVTDDVLRSLTLSQALLGTREVMVVQHTGCGLHADEDDLRNRVEAATGTRPDQALGGFADLRESVRAQVARLREAPGLPAGANARGFVYDVATGRLEEIS